MRRQMSTTPKASTAAALLCDNNTHTRTFADDIEDVVALGIMGNVFDDFDNGTGRRSPSNNATHDDDRVLCRLCREEILLVDSNVDLPNHAPTMTTRSPAKNKKFCTSCKSYLDIETCLLGKGKTCSMCLKKHKLYERRKRKQRDSKV